MSIAGLNHSGLAFENVHRPEASKPLPLWERNPSPGALPR